MVTSKAAAWLLLIFVLGALVFSVISMFQGRLDQAVLFTPILFVLYIFGVGMRKKQDQDSSKHEDSDDVETSEPHKPHKHE